MERFATAAPDRDASRGFAEAKGRSAGPQARSADTNNASSAASNRFVGEIRPDVTAGGAPTVADAAGAVGAVDAAGAVEAAGAVKAVGAAAAGAVEAAGAVKAAGAVGAADDAEAVEEEVEADAPERRSARFKKLEAQLRGEAGRAIVDYRMIEDGDRVMVCLSGGKDSYTLLDMLISLRRRAPVEFDLVAVNLDQKQPGFPAHVLPSYLERLGVEHRIVEEDTYSVVKRVISPGKTMCGLCSRLRRGILYRVADELRATKIALGHHRDDIVETLFLNMFHGGRLKAMPPKLLSDDGRHVIIRPLAYSSERDIARYARGRDFPIIPCNLCGSQDNLQRVKIKDMLADWERQDPGRLDRLFRALQNVTPSHLADRALYDFASLSAAPDAGDGVEEG